MFIFIQVRKRQHYSLFVTNRIQVSAVAVILHVDTVNSDKANSYRLLCKDGCSHNHIHFNPFWPWHYFSLNTTKGCVPEQTWHRLNWCDNSSRDTFLLCKCSTQTYHFSSCTWLWWSRTQCRGLQTGGSKSENDSITIFNKWLY